MRAVSPLIKVSRWQRFKWALRRQRKPIVRLWDADFNYISTIVDGGRETWRQWARRLLLTTPNSGRQTIGLSNGATLTVDADVI